MIGTGMRASLSYRRMSRRLWRDALRLRKDAFAHRREGRVEKAAEEETEAERVEGLANRARRAAEAEMRRDQPVGGQ